MENLELLCPAGDAEALRAAVDFGADAVYLAGQAYGMRTASKNFDEAGLREAIRYAHQRGVKVHVTCNTLPRNGELDQLPAFLELVADAGADALIVADLGVLSLAKRYAPGVALHASVQAGVVNYEAARALYELGVQRVVLARELTLEEIAGIRAKTPRELELEAFIHGAVCISESGRCLLSSYMTGRDAARGDCAQPCRWRYALMEEKRPGQFFSIAEEGAGAYILNSKDLCMAEHLPKLTAAGVTSFKIEGRAKSSYYAAVTAGAYRAILDAYIKDPAAPPPSWALEELQKISHRPYSTGFYLGKPEQETVSGGYQRSYQLAAVAVDWREGMLTLRQRNKFIKGETLDCLEPGGPSFLIPVQEMYDEQGGPIDAAPHAEMTVRIPCSRPVKPGAFLRRNLK
ncbi:MAG: U32 family peptidase [Clostridiales bacterium]|nr:U32 family peptidase [Clostridiales bacterium]